jgi:hypothetical protein
MISTAIVRRLGPLLVGLYVVAQICGVTPIISRQSAHDAAWPSFLSEGKSTHQPSQDHHHAGDADDAANHHVLQDLNGVLAHLPDRGENAVVHLAIWATTPDTLTKADPVRLERRPKPFLSV